MKKYSIGILAFLLLCTIPVAVFASEPGQYVVSNQTVSAGEEFQLDVAVTNNPGVVTLRFKVEYDETALELLGVENKGLFQGYTAPSPTISSPYTLRWADSLATTNNTANGVVCTVRFRALTTGSSSVKISHAEARNANGQKVSFTDANAAVTISVPVACDLNGDRKIDADDLAILARHIAKIELINDEDKEKLADVTGDKSVTAADLTALAQYIKAQQTA